jgi:hypothetical protein
MKKFLLISILFVTLMLPSLLFAATASLQYSAVTTNTDGTPITDLAGYNAYDVTGTRTKLNSSTIPTTACVAGVCTWDLPTLPTEGKKFVVTAIDTTSHESADSNTATYTNTPSAPASLIIKIP